MNFLNGSIHHDAQQRKDENTLGPSPFGDAEYIVDDSPITNSWIVGTDLTPADYTALEGRWIDRRSADRAQLRRVDSLTGAQIICRKNGNYAGILIPYFQPGSDRVREYRLRRDQPDLEYDSSGNLKARQKYLCPPGRSNMLYLVNRVEPSLLSDPELPIVITEGEFKTLALWRLANHGLPAGPRFLPVGVSASTTGAAQSAKPSVPMAAALT